MNKTIIAEALHSVYSPSGAWLWTKCLKSLDVLDKDEDNGEADKGTVVHKIGEQCLQFGMSPTDYLGLTIDEIEITEKEVSAAATYVNFVNSMAIVYRQRPMIEQRVYMSSIDVDVFGTFDAGFITGSKLHIIDYKNGYVLVDIKNNLQFIMYAIGYLDEHNLWNAITEVETTVVQPNGFHGEGPVRSYSYTIDYLRKMQTYIRDVVSTHKSGDYGYNAGEHCIYCPRRARCKANYLMMIDVNFYDDEDLTDDELIAKFKLIPALNKSIAEIQDQVYKSAKRGLNVPGYKLVKSRARAEIKDEDEFVNDMVEREGINVNDLYQFKLKPIGELKKIVRYELLPRYINNPDAGDTLVPMSDPRRAISGLTAFPDLTKTDTVPPDVTTVFTNIQL